MSFADRVDRFQREHAWLGLPLAVVYKFYDDEAGYLVALLTYYGFLSVFPLLLLLLTVLGYVASGDQALQQRLVDSALVDLPVLGPQLRENVHAYTGNGVALTVGIVGTLYGGTGIMQAAQSAFNRVYAVERNRRPNPLTARLRSLAVLLVLGSGVLATTGVSVLISTANSVSAGLAGWLRALAVVLTVALDAALFVAAYRMLTATRLRTRDVLVGAVLAAVVWEGLQVLGTSLLAHELNHAREVYGTFGLVLGALSWIYLQALAVLIGAELNVVVHRQVWPRSLLTPFTDAVDLTDADERAYDSYAKRERFKGFERVAVDFDHPPRGRRRRPVDDG